MSKRETPAAFEKRMRAITVPPGFTAEMGEGSWCGKTHTFFILKSSTVKIKFDQWGGGHTSFEVEGRGWLSFDRTGVEDSFYHVDYSGKVLKASELNDLVKEQFKRIDDRRRYYVGAVNIPGLPFTVAPDGIEQLKAKLRKQGSLSFYPSGFGTGYTISRKAGRYNSMRAKPELETFLGYSPLYVTTMDCD